MSPLIARLVQAMIAYDHGDAKRIHHFLKVHSFAVTIGTLEELPPQDLFILEAAAVLHDVGIHISEAKYGSSAGHYQEIEGPAQARIVMQQVGGFSALQQDRICFLVGHHHTYTGVDALDYQILLEADFLVNVYEDNVAPEAAEAFRRNVFRTATGLSLLHSLLH